MFALRYQIAILTFILKFKISYVTVSIVYITSAIISAVYWRHHLNRLKLHPNRNHWCMSRPNLKSGSILNWSGPT